MTHQRSPETAFVGADPTTSGGPGIWPIPPSPLSGDGPPPGYTESYGRADYRAFRLGNALVIQAWGTLPYLNQIPDLRQSPLKIYPPQFDFWVYSPPFGLPALKPFKISEIFGFPSDATTVVIHDADGHHAIEIEDIAFDDAAAIAGKASKAAPEKTGYGKSFEEAFAAGVAALPTSEPGSADSLAQYRLVESGLLRGGIAGVNLHYAKVEVTFS